MNYRTDKYGNRLSILGFGCMRFPMKAGRIDMAETEREILTAVEGGIYYFDTAYIYPGSEAALGEILERNRIRDRVYIATKLPHYLIKNRESLDKLLAEELRRLRTDHVDYYLMHMLTDTATWERLLALGIGEWLAEKAQPCPVPDRAVAVDKPTRTIFSEGGSVCGGTVRAKRPRSMQVMASLGCSSCVFGTMMAQLGEVSKQNAILC